jgi:hypothetical protein
MRSLVSSRVTRMRGLFDGALPVPLLRNAGARHSGGETLWFTDDDCLAQVDWVEELMAAIEDRADAVRGTTLTPGGTSRCFGDHLRAPALASETFAPSNKLACKKAVFEAVPLDDSLHRALE